MKVLLVALLGIGVALNTAQAGDATLKTGEGTEAPANGFATMAELFRWAATSSFGGGGVSSYHLGEQDVHVVNRAFTSGRASTELSFYVQKPDGKGFQRVLLLPQRTAEIRTKLEDDTIVLERYDFRKGTWVKAMTVTQHALDP